LDQKTVTKLTVVCDEGRGKNIHHSRTNWNDWIKKMSWWRWRESNPPHSVYLQWFKETGVTIGVTEFQKSFTESLRKS